MESYIKEKSCGAIIYMIKGRQPLFLLIQQRAGHYGFPKGHVEKNETEIETARREIKEETNLDVNINTNFREITTYSPSLGVMKDVVFFIATPSSLDIKVQETEVACAKWVTYDEAMKLLTHQDNKNLLKKALNFIKVNELKIK